MDYAAANAQIRKDKAALTRALNKARKVGTVEAWRKVIDAVDKATANWDAQRWAWPDSWHTWNIARQDAVHAIRRLGGEAQDRIL
jgi:hypothetical protein